MENTIIYCIWYTSSIFGTIETHNHLGVMPTNHYIPHPHDNMKKSTILFKMFYLDLFGNPNFNNLPFFFQILNQAN
jgi:hypothetical protein